MVLSHVLCIRQHIHKIYSGENCRYWGNSYIFPSCCSAVFDVATVTISGLPQMSRAVALTQISIYKIWLGVPGNAGGGDPAVGIGLDKFPLRRNY